jgi:Mg/Co/Ni transporter MgtE
MNKKNNLKVSETVKTIYSLDTNVSNNSFGLMTIENGKVIKKVSFNQKVSIIEVQNFKRLNIKNSMTYEEILENLRNEKNRREEEKREREEEERQNISCNQQCSLF